MQRMVAVLASLRSDLGENITITLHIGNLLRLSGWRLGLLYMVYYISYDFLLQAVIIPVKTVSPYIVHS